jgi:tetratricopeptide (TPR) repeat protein
MDKTDNRDLALHLSIIGMILVIVFSSCSTFYHMKDWRHFPQNDAQQRYKITQKDLAEFTHSLKPRRQDPESLYQQARYFQRKGKHKLATQLLTEAILANPAHVKAYNAIGVSYDILGDHPRAIEGYKRALKLNPDLAYVQNNLGYSYLLNRKYDSAIAAFQAAVRLDSRNEKYHNNLGLAYAKKGLYDLAFAEFKKAGNEATANYNMDRIYSRASRHTKAEILMSKSSKMDPAIQPSRTDPMGISNLAAANMALPEIQDHSIWKGNLNGVNSDHQKDQIQDNIPIKEEEPKLDTMTNPMRRDIIEDPEIEVSNGNGVNRMAARVGRYLQKNGFDATIFTNAEHFNFPVTTILYHKDYLQDAFNVARHIPGYQNMEKIAQFDPQNIKVKVLIGRDLIAYDRFFRYQLKRDSRIALSKKF